MTNTTTDGTRDLQALATEVANLLEWDWYRDERFSNHVAHAVIRLGEQHKPGERDVMTISFRQSTWKKDKRIEIQAYWPTHDDGRSMHHVTPRKWIDGKESGLPEGSIKITVAADASPDRVAKEIQRRIMPGYVRGWADCMAQIQEMTAAQDETAEIARRLGVEKGSSGEYSKSIDCDENGPGHATVRVAHGKVTIEARSLNEATAAKILKILRGE